MVAGQSGKKVLAIIPARGGSKRIPKKNILEFNGKPMINWTVEAALASKIFEEVIVSTDDKEIADIAISAGATVPFLREEAADDNSPVSFASIAALHQIEEYKGEKYDIVVQLMANCPLRTGNTILDLYNSFLRNQKSSVISGFKYGMANPWWAHVVSAESSKPLFKKEMTERSQDLPKLLCPTGAVWISDRSRLIEERTFYSKDYQIGEIPWVDAIDIDEWEDLELANVAYQIRRSNLSL